MLDEYIDTAVAWIFFWIVIHGHQPIRALGVSVHDTMEPQSTTHNTCRSPPSMLLIIRSSDQIVLLNERIKVAAILWPVGRMRSKLIATASVAEPHRQAAIERFGRYELAGSWTVLVDALHSTVLLIVDYRRLCVLNQFVCPMLVPHPWFSTPVCSDLVWV